MPNGAKICELEFYRKDGEQFMKIKVDPEIEDIFKTEETETSEKYQDNNGEGLEYYSLKPKLQRLEEKFSSKLGREVELTKYGTSLYLNGSEPNLSIMRTVGLTGGVQVRVDDLIMEEDVERWTSDLSNFLKYLYQEFIDESPIKVTVTLES